jgi:2-polyprenyl-6-methoxyphenol hydroxylase-like FAD-dependent oxidoreductase
LLAQLAASGCPAIEQVTAGYGSVAISGRPSAVDGTAVMYCPRRTVLDPLLVDAARAAGAEMRDSVKFHALVWDDDRVVGVRLQDKDGVLSEVGARVVVGADGLWSPVARAAGVEVDIEHETLTCGYYAYWSGVPTDGVEFYVRQGSDILVFPTHDGFTCIWVGRSRREWVSWGCRGDVPRDPGAGTTAHRAHCSCRARDPFQGDIDGAQHLSAERRVRLGAGG